MLRDKQFDFFKEKISEISTALFFNNSDAVLKIPSSVISVIKIDDVAQLWFFVPQPRQYLNEFETSFNCKMTFFRKGMNCYMKIDGKAHIVSDPEEVNNLIDLPEDAKYKAATRQAVLIKVRIGYVHFFECRKLVPINWLAKSKDLLYKWIFNQRPGYRPYRLQTERLAI